MLRKSHPFSARLTTLLAEADKFPMEDKLGWLVASLHHPDNKDLLQELTKTNPDFLSQLTPTMTLDAMKNVLKLPEAIFRKKRIDINNRWKVINYRVATVDSLPRLLTEDEKKKDTARDKSTLLYRPGSSDEKAPVSASISSTLSIAEKIQQARENLMADLKKEGLSDDIINAWMKKPKEGILGKDDFAPTTVDEKDEKVETRVKRSRKRKPETDDQEDEVRYETRPKLSPMDELKKILERERSTGEFDLSELSVRLRNRFPKMPAEKMNELIRNYMGGMSPLLKELAKLSYRASSGKCFDLSPEFLPFEDEFKEYFDYCRICSGLQENIKHYDKYAAQIVRYTKNQICCVPKEIALKIGLCNLNLDDPHIFLKIRGKFVEVHYQNVEKMNAYWKNKDAQGEEVTVVAPCPSPTGTAFPALPAASPRGFVSTLLAPSSSSSSSSLSSAIAPSLSADQTDEVSVVPSLDTEPDAEEVELDADTLTSPSPSGYAVYSGVIAPGMCLFGSFGIPTNITLPLESTSSDSPLRQSFSSARKYSQLS